MNFQKIRRELLQAQDNGETETKAYQFLHQHKQERQTRVAE
ncbi:hypothetical protein [Pontibacter qinzhouensis]|nr:hypothetical protein [Pontibacter qinzhouensis]